MSQKSKRICKCCGKQYEYCPHCGKHSDELWRNITDTEECREVLNIVSAYNMKLANKDQVKKVLDKFGVTDYGKYKDSISSVLNELFGKKQEDVQKKAAVVVESVAPTPVAEVEEERSIKAEPEVPAVEVRYTPAPVVDQPLATAEVEVPTMPKEEAPKEDRNSYKRRKRRRYNMDVDSQ